jgi:environmental stress-induced protein Ves
MGADRVPEHLGVVRFAELNAVPWLNGGGLTREVAVAGGSGPHGFDWRISIADVTEAGPFSSYPGVDRIITVVEGEGMDLAIDGVEHVLGLHEPLSFDGASMTSCSRLAGPIRDLNVMTRSDTLSAGVAIRDLSQTRPIAVDDRQVLVLLSGSAVVVGADGSRAELHLLDAVCPRGEHVRLVEGSGRAAVIRIEEHHQAHARRSESRVGEAPATTVQITFDCADPQALAQFWQAALHYIPQPPPQGHRTWEAWLAAMGVPQSEWNDGASIFPPEGTGPTLYFQKVPEPKTVKNRIHLDLDIAFGSDPIAARTAHLEAEVVRLSALGATVIARVAEHDHFHVTMCDPEGNEFDLR